MKDCQERIKGLITKEESITRKLGTNRALLTALQDRATDFIPGNPKGVTWEVIEASEDPGWRPVTDHIVSNSSERRDPSRSNVHAGACL